MNSPLLLAALPAVPALGALLLALSTLSRRRLPYNAAGGIATLAAGASFAIALALLPLGILGTGGMLSLDLGPWIAAGDFHAAFRLTLDSASQTMVLLVTFFGFVITGYSVGYMRHDPAQGQQARFFASLNLFVASMLVLVLADNLALIFLGWEGVGLCSYLLIGHYWNERGDGKDVPLAAFRAFFVNRIGDLLFMLGVFTVLAAFGTLSLSDLSTLAASGHGASAFFAGREGMAALAAFLLLGGAFAKSAQAPLHVWLADAMAGPTPVSALIHAATMVTAGVYLVMRLDWLYAVVPQARFLIGICALVTLVVGAFMALTQHDIKKILAYSTLSNLALMFLALAAGSSRAAMLHLFGHAFFKALLFLAAGSVILSSHHEQDARRLGGALRTMPVTRAAFWVGCLGGAGLIPFFSAGFFTKESVLESIRLASFDAPWFGGLHVSGHVLYGIALTVETLSALYFFRLLGYLEGSADVHADPEGRGHARPRETSPAIRLVLVLLAIAAPAFAAFSAGPALTAWVTGGAGEFGRVHLAHVAPFLVLNIVLAALTFAVFVSPSRRARALAMLSASSWKGRLAGKGPLDRKFWFDDLYAAIVAWPLKAFAWTLRLGVESVFVGLLRLFGATGRGASRALRRLQTGYVHHYAALILFFAALAAWYLLRGNA